VGIGRTCAEKQGASAICHAKDPPTSISSLFDFREPTRRFFYLPFITDLQLHPAGMRRRREGHEPRDREVQPRPAAKRSRHDGEQPNEGGSGLMADDHVVAARAGAGAAGYNSEAGSPRPFMNRFVLVSLSAGGMPSEFECNAHVAITGHMQHRNLRSRPSLRGPTCDCCQRSYNDSPLPNRPLPTPWLSSSLLSSLLFSRSRASFVHKSRRWQEKQPSTGPEPPHFARADRDRGQTRRIWKGPHLHDQREFSGVFTGGSTRRSCCLSVFSFSPSCCSMERTRPASSLCIVASKRESHQIPTVA
jgi:hypothetical protein